MVSRPKRPRDPNQLAKLIVGLSTGEIEEGNPAAGKNPKRVASGQKGGLKGGASRMEAMTKEQRTALAKQAAAARWGKTPPTTPVGGAKAKSAKQR